jgi:hypothetical protein
MSKYVIVQAQGCLIFFRVGSTSVYLVYDLTQNIKLASKNLTRDKHCSLISWACTIKLFMAIIYGFL